jgi:hypothetical protein
MYTKLVIILLLTVASLALSAIAVPLSRYKGFSSDGVIRFIRDNRTLISIVVQVLSTLLALSQTYVVTSLVGLATNARLHRDPPRLDTFKLLQAITTKSPIFGDGMKASLISVISLLLLQLPAALWAGSITPTINELTETTEVQVPDFDQATSKYWASRCVPAQECDELLGGTQDLGTFSYVNWKGLSSESFPFSTDLCSKDRPVGQFCVASFFAKCLYTSLPKARRHWLLLPRPIVRCWLGRWAVAAYVLG